jgi:hypothetical protein
MASEAASRRNLFASQLSRQPTSHCVPAAGTMRPEFLPSSHPAARPAPMKTRAPRAVSREWRPPRRPLRVGLIGRTAHRKWSMVVGMPASVHSMLRLEPGLARSTRPHSYSCPARSRTTARTCSTGEDRGCWARVARGLYTTPIGRLRPKSPHRRGISGKRAAAARWEGTSSDSLGVRQSPNWPPATDSDRKGRGRVAGICQIVASDVRNSHARTSSGTQASIIADFRQTTPLDTPDEARKLRM